MQYLVVDDEQNQKTFVVVDEYGQRVTNIGLPYELAMKTAISMASPSKETSHA